MAFYISRPSSTTGGVVSDGEFCPTIAKEQAQFNAIIPRDKKWTWWEWKPRPQQCQVLREELVQFPPGPPLVIRHFLMRLL